MYCLFCDVSCIVCVYMCTELLPPGFYPLAVKYIISYLVPTDNSEPNVKCMSLLPYYRIAERSNASTQTEKTLQVRCVGLMFIITNLLLEFVSFVAWGQF
jgi:hypothetical protein